MSVTTRPLVQYRRRGTLLTNPASARAPARARRRTAAARAGAAARRAMADSTVHHQAEPSTRWRPQSACDRMEIDTVAGVRNLTQAEAAERARLLTVTEYDISLDLTDGTGGP